MNCSIISLLTSYGCKTDQDLEMAIWKSFDARLDYPIVSQSVSIQLQRTRFLQRSSVNSTDSLQCHCDCTRSRVQKVEPCISNQRRIQNGGVSCMYQGGVIQALESKTRSVINRQSELVYIASCLLYSWHEMHAYWTRQHAEWLNSYCQYVMRGHRLQF